MNEKYETENEILFNKLNCLLFAFAVSSIGTNAHKKPLLFAQVFLFFSGLVWFGFPPPLIVTIVGGCWLAVILLLLLLPLLIFTSIYNVSRLLVQLLILTCLPVCLPCYA